MKRTPDLKDSVLLANYCNEHVYYEVWMLFSLSDLLLMPFAAPNPELATVLRNVVVESFGVHLRNLVDFLYPRSTVKTSDVIAADYYPNGSLPHDFPKISSSLERARRRADKELSHLTTSRISGAPPEKAWEHKELAAEIRKLLLTFVSSAPIKLARLSTWLASRQ